MLIHITKASYISGHKIKLVFDDQKSGTVDLSNVLKGPIFGPLKDVNYFKRFKLNKEAGTIMWDNGADFAPEFLYEKATSHK